MIEYIVIPTLGRINKQMTYNRLPSKHKAMVRFVVQSQEFEEMKAIYSDQVICLPEHIKTIAPTREWICTERFSDNQILLLDDDMYFIHKEPNKARKVKEDPPPWYYSTRVTEDEQFDDLLRLINNWIDEGYMIGGIQPSSYIPMAKYYPSNKNSRITGAFFFDCKRLPKDLNWTRVPCAEDLDIVLQMLSRGIPNILCTEYVYHSPTVGSAKGGCNTYRDVHKHNESQFLLQQYWPDYIKLKEGIAKEGPWKGEVLYRLHIQTKKVYKDWVKRSKECDTQK